MTLKTYLTYPYWARLRAMWLSLRMPSSDIRGKSLIFRPIIITPRSIMMGRRVFINKQCRIEGVTNYLGQSFSPTIVLEDEVSIEQHLHLTCAERIVIGFQTAIGANVTITDIDHPYEDPDVSVERQPLRTKPVEIGSGCKIYNNAVILPGTVMGDHCVVGANSVVCGTFPGHCVIVGAPARVVKKYNHNTKQWEKVF